MTDLAFPSDLAPESMEWKLERNVTTITNPLSKTSQYIGRAGDRWRCTMTMPKSNGIDAGILTSYFDQISRAENFALVSPPQNYALGSESGSTFTDQNGSWRSQANAAGNFPNWTQTNLLLPAYLAGGWASIYGSATTPATMARNFTVTVGAYYLVVVDVPPQEFTARMRVKCGSTTLFDSGNVSAAGRIVALVVPTTTTMQVLIYAGFDGTAYANTYYGDISVTRCYTVEQASAAGSNSVVIQGGITNPSLRVGQFVGIQSSWGFELKRLTREVVQIGGGSINGLAVNHVGRLLFEPALRGSVAVGAAIQHVDMACRMKLATPSSVSTVQAPNFTGMTFELVEDVT